LVGEFDREEVSMGQLRRRQFLIGSGALLTAPLVRARSSGRIVRIGRLCQGKCPAPESDEFLAALRALGWIEGRNLEVDRASGDASRLARVAAELVGRKPDLIFTVAPPASLAARNATASIPIVFTFVADPVKVGLVKSLAHPGGNATGLATLADAGVGGKRFQLLKEIVPGATRGALLINPDNAIHRLIARNLAADEAATRLRIRIYEARSADAIEPAIAAAAREGAQLLVQPGDAVLSNPPGRVPQLALRARLASCYWFAWQVEAGGFISYGPDPHDSIRRAAEYANRILKGARPADLPVERPTKYEFAINLKTAKALGLTIPPAIRLRADRVIE
jgi:putative ABC transport system substrate-binding protein